MQPSSEHDEGDCNEGDANDEANEAKDDASNKLDNVVGDSVANCPSDLFDTISGIDRPVIVGERISDHPVDCSEIFGVILFLLGVFQI